MHSARLQQILDEYDVSLDHLLRRCKGADPKLVNRHLPMKRALPNSTIQLHSKVLYAGFKGTLICS
jgi:hypothetical protein